MASEREMELFTISSEVPEARSLQKSAFTAAEEIELSTEHGVIKVAIQGNPKKPAIVTYHDIGLNHVTCFQGFFHFSDMQTILQHFCVYHVNAPGQGEHSLPLMQGQYNRQRDGYKYPTMDELADTVSDVVEHFKLRTVIGFGVGAGANILVRFALKHPKKCEALCLVNASASACGWVEWGYQKFNSYYLKSGNLTNFTQDYLLWHWFGRGTKATHSDLVHVYTDYIKAVNPINLSMFIDSYSGRADLKIRRPADLQDKTTYTVPCETMLVIGDTGPSVDDTIEMNNRMDPAKTQLVKLQDCGGMVLEESPDKLAESFRLFLQGLGYIPLLSQAKIVEARSKHRSIPTAVAPALESNDKPQEAGDGADDLSPMLI